MAEHELDTATLAYVAGVVDLLGLIRTRITQQGTELPYVALSGPNTQMLEYLGELTDTRPTITRRSYSKAGCAEHCQEKHQHVVSVSGRWSVSGVKATVVLWNIRPFLRLQADAAREALVVGVATGFKPATVKRMAELGWDVPEFEGRAR
jgi:hypothetical protein